MSADHPTLLENLTAIAKRFREARELRLSTGMWLHVVEVRLRDADQKPALMEHCERAVDTPGAGVFGIPVHYDADVPPSTLRLVYEDGSTADSRLA